MRSAVRVLSVVVATLSSAAACSGCFGFGDRPPPGPAGGSISGTIQVQSVTGQAAHNGDLIRDERDQVAASLDDAHPGPLAPISPVDRPAPATTTLAPAKSKMPLRWAAGQVLVQFDVGAYDKTTIAPALKSMLKAGGVDAVPSVVRCTWERYCKVILRHRDGRLLDVGETDRAESAMNKNKAAHVHVVAKNLKKTGFFVPNDPLFSFQWHYDVIHMQAAWDIEQGDDNLVVAIVDSGAVTAHPDLTNRWARDNQARIVGTDMVEAQDDNDDQPGRDTNPEDPGDNLFGNGNSSWHGTHIAGTIGAETNNGQGVAGITIRGRIEPVRVLGNQLTGEDADIMDGILWAVGQHVDGSPDNVSPARVVNLSLGGPTDDASQQFWNENLAAVLQLSSKPILVVAAGNSDEDAAGIVPANVDGMITVGATNIQGTRASYSNFGPKVTLVAPGGDEGTDINADGQPDGVLSTVNPDFDWRDGTSMATPHVTGVAALLLAVNPNLAQADVATLLKQSADHTFQCNEGCGAGMLDAVAALLAAGGNIQQNAAMTTDVTTVTFPDGFQLRNVNVLNLGQAPFSFTATIDGPQASLFSVTPASGTVAAAGGTDPANALLSVTLTRGTFLAGSANLKIATTDQTPEQDVSVSLNFNDDPTRTPNQIQEVQVAAFKKATDGTLVSVAQAIAKRSGGFAYKIEGLKAGDYYVYAVGDDNNDGTFDSQTESFGAYPTEDSPALVHVDGKNEVKDKNFGISSSFISGIVGGVGAACTKDSDCNFLPDAGCITSFSGGYCSRFCGEAVPAGVPTPDRLGQCGDNGRCDRLKCTQGDGTQVDCDVCLQKCTSDAQCRFADGYHCSLNECVPANF